MKRNKLLIFIGAIVATFAALISIMHFSYAIEPTWVSLPPGLYNDNDELVISWDDLVNNYGFDISNDESYMYNYDEDNDQWLHLVDTINYNIENINYNDIPQNTPFVVLRANPTGTKLIIPEGVSYIGQCAFQSTNIKAIKIPSTVTSLGYITFAGNDNLETIYIDENNQNYKSDDNFIFTKDGKNLLLYYSLGQTSVTVPDGVETIAEDSINSDTLTSIYLPSSLTKIENYGVYAYSLRYAYFADSTGWFRNGYEIDFSDPESAANYLVNTPYYAYEKGTQNVDVPSWAAVAPGLYNYYGELLVSWQDLVDNYGFDIESDTDYYYYKYYSDGNWHGNGGWTYYSEVPSSAPAKALYDYGCYDDQCRLIIPEGITKIGEKTLYGLYYAYIAIPSTVVSIGTTAFDGSSATLYINNNNRYYATDGTNLFSKYFKTFIKYYSCDYNSYSVPDMVEVIEKDAFNCNGYIYTPRTSSIFIPSSVKKIKPNAFTNLSSLRSIQFSDPYNWNIGGTIFYLSNSQSNYNIFNYYYPYFTAVKNGTSTVTVPGVYDSENNLIMNWEDLVSTYGFNPQTNLGILRAKCSREYNNDFLTSPDDPICTKEHYLDGLPTSIPYVALSKPEFEDAITLVIPDDIEYIGEYAFAFTKIKSVHLPSQLKVIKDHAFPEDLDIVHINAEDDAYIRVFWGDEDNTYSLNSYDPYGLAYDIRNASAVHTNLFYEMNETTNDKQIEDLLYFYNVVTLGTREKLSISAFQYDTSSYRNGSLLNPYSVGGPVMVRGDLTVKGGVGTYSYEDRSGTVTKTEWLPGEVMNYANGTQTIVGGKIIGEVIDDSTSKMIFGKNQSQSSLNRYITDFSVNDFSSVYCPVPTECTLYNYNNISNYDHSINYYLYASDINQYNFSFDKIYYDVVAEQAKIKQGTILTFNSTNNTVNENKIEITQPGYYTVDLSNLDGFKWNSKVINIKNYNPNATYVITVKGEYIYTPIEITLDGKEPTEITGKTEYMLMNSSYTGNVILSYPEAKYIYFNKENLGHIIAPNADVEVNGWRMIGAIIANSVTFEKDYTNENNDGNGTVQLFPYTGNNLELNDTAYTYKTNISEIYQGTYSLLEMIKNYGVITLGQKDLSDDSILNGMSASKGTASIEYAAAPILVEGDLGVSPSPDTNVFGYTSTYNGGNQFASSFVKGSIKSGNTGFTLTDNQNVAMDSDEIYIGTSNQIMNGLGYHTPFWHYNDYRTNIVTSYFTLTDRLVMLSSLVTGSGNSYFKTDKPIFNSDSYLNFLTLYNNLYSTQKSLSKGKQVTPDTDGIIYLQEGGIYNIKNINSTNKIIIKKNDSTLDALTLINILDTGAINTFPEVLVVESGECTTKTVGTNKYYNYHQAISANDTVVTTEEYTGNIIWNMPDASLITMPYRNIIGHVLAPNADVQLIDTNVSGTVIANSLFTSGTSEVRYYPFQLSEISINNVPVKFYSVDDLTLEDLSGITYELYNSSNTKIDEWVSCSECAKYHESLLIPNETYTIKQINVLDSYLKLDPITFSIDQNGTVSLDNQYTDVDDNGDLVLRNTKTRTIKATIVWNDMNNVAGIRPLNVTLNLLVDGNVFKSYDIGSENALTELNIPVSLRGRRVTYTLTENGVENYTIEVNHTVVSNSTDALMVDEFTIVNSYRPSTISITINKVWDDENNKDRIRPANVFVDVYEDGLLLNTVELKSSNNWVYIYNGLSPDKTYTIEEKVVPGYNDEITGDSTNGYTVTNKHEVVPEQDPEPDPDPTPTPTPTPPSPSPSSSPKPKTYKCKIVDGQYWGKNKTRVTQEVYEDECIEKEPIEEPKKVTLTINKVWDDENNTDNLRPESVEVYIYANDNLLKTVTLTKENKWIYVSDELDMYVNNVLISYTVTEKDIEGYKSTVNETTDYVYTITNTHKVKHEEPQPTEEPKPEEKKETKSTTIYIFGGIGILLIIFFLILFLFKKKKDEEAA